jgi:hypothetical protein
VFECVAMYMFLLICSIILADGEDSCTWTCIIYKLWGQSTSQMFPLEKGEGCITKFTFDFS